MADQYFDFTSSEVAILKQLCQSGAVTMSALAERLSQINGSGFSLPIYEAVIDTGVITLPRLGQTMIVRVDTEGQVSSDAITELAPFESGTWKDGDIIIFFAESPARIVSFADGNNIDLKGATGSTADLVGASSTLCMVYDLRNEMWVEAWRTPNNTAVVSDSIGFTQDTVTIDTGAVTSTKSYLKIQSARSGEVLAAVQIEITAAGTDAVFSLYIDEGAGQFLLCTESWVGTPLITTQLTDIVAAIAASGTGYTATDDGVDTVTVSAPAGTGATPNATWTSEAIGTGGMTFTAGSDTFAGGVDGADADDDLDTIYGIQPNQLLWIENIMTANTITLKDGTGNFSLGADMVLNPLEIAAFIIKDSAIKKILPGVDIIHNRIPITSADILTLNSVPIELVPAPPVGYALMLYKVSSKITFNTTAYATNTNLQINTGDMIHAESDAILPALGTRHYAIGNYAPTVAGLTNQYIENSAMMLTVETGDPTAGDSNIVLYIYYIIVKI